MIKFRAQRTDNGEMVEGNYAECTSRGQKAFYIFTFREGSAHHINPDTLEQYINGEWMKPEAFEKLKQQRDGLLEVMKEINENSACIMAQAVSAKAIAEAEAK